MNISSLKCAAFFTALTMAIPAVAQNSSLQDIVDIASAAVDAARERSEQATSTEEVKAIFAKAEDAAEDGTINFCGFYLGMSEADARTLASHYGLKDGQWQIFSIASTKQVSRLTFTLRSVRRITKGGNSFDELSQAVANRVGTMKRVKERILDDDFDSSTAVAEEFTSALFGELAGEPTYIEEHSHVFDGYMFKNIDGEIARISEKEGLTIESVSLMQKAVAERAEAKRLLAAEAERREWEGPGRVAVSKLAADMVPIPDKNYSMCKYEVTQALWFAVMGENPSQFKGANLPVENVSWNDCQKFLEKLNALPEIKASGRVYRLPTLGEWDVACLAGAKRNGGYGKLADGTSISYETLGTIAWHGNGDAWEIAGNSESKTHPVGQKEANAFGLYDMHGNVMEWTVTPHFFDGKQIVCKGGCWNSGALSCSVENEETKAPDNRSNDLGFRLAADRELTEVERVKRTEIIAELATNMVAMPNREFSICKFEVSQELWEAVMGGNMSRNLGASLPVENVSWGECQMFLGKLNTLPEVKASGHIYRLPTADEWEYACRAGAEGDYCMLEDGKEVGKGWLNKGSIGSVAWYEDNSGDKTHPVGQKKPNAFGLYDMLGNVEEWTSTADNGRFLHCGGSFQSDADACKSRSRHTSRTFQYYRFIGLRLAADKSK